MNLPAHSFLNEADKQLLPTSLRLRLIETLSRSNSLMLSLSLSLHLPQALPSSAAKLIVSQISPLCGFVVSRKTNTFYYRNPASSFSPSSPSVFSPSLFLFSIERTLLCKLYYLTPLHIFPPSHIILFFSAFIWGLPAMQPRPTGPHLSSCHHMCVLNTALFLVCL